MFRQYFSGKYGQMLAKELIQLQIWYKLYISHLIHVVLYFILKADICVYLDKVSHFLINEAFAEQVSNYFGAVHENTIFSDYKLNLKLCPNPPSKILKK